MAPLERLPDPVKNSTQVCRLSRNPRCIVAWRTALLTRRRGSGSVERTNCIESTFFTPERCSQHQVPQFALAAIGKLTGLTGCGRLDPQPSRPPIEGLPAGRSDSGSVSQWPISG